ncbi:hypothetical protein BDN71DRAFT_1223878 [Pleurotus eryngii]|uniref:Uncharacterized protein n=1 Tax=Pleurotus eryngii TaxID=5323 RepID=A0A9P5ZQN4_PLEER|nr:hypothetical protein BDN71DRAFT_1223878 [Pleurotus eryngii]
MFKAIDLSRDQIAGLCSLLYNGCPKMVIRRAVSLSGFLLDFKLMSLLLLWTTYQWIGRPISVATEPALGL